MSDTPNTTQISSVAENAELPNSTALKAVEGNQITLSSAAGKREVKISTKFGFSLGFISALIIVIVLLILFG